MGGHAAKTKPPVGGQPRKHTKGERAERPKRDEKPPEKKPLDKKAASGDHGGAKKRPQVHFKDEKAKQHATTLLGDVSVLSKTERPSRKLWWLAGGRTAGQVPTAGELRDRRKVEDANRATVGFLGTILGVRAVTKVPKKPGEKDAPSKRGR